MHKKDIYGSIHVITGLGKGKTTSALGTALLFAGKGLKVIMVQFIKGRRFSEHRAVKKIPNLEIIPMGKGFFDLEKPFKEDTELAHKTWKFAKEKIFSEDYNLIILDEINPIISYGILNVEDIIEILRKKPPHLYIILTGRYAHPLIIQIADDVTEMKLIKHPYQKGIKARKGIEF